MTHQSIGFIDEIEKLAVGKQQFKRMLKDPFSKRMAPWKSLSKWQKARVGAGIAANTAFGVVPLVGGTAYGVKKLLGPKEDYEKKYKELERRNQIRDELLNA